MPTTLTFSSLSLNLSINFGQACQYENDLKHKQTIKKNCNLEIRKRINFLETLELDQDNKSWFKVQKQTS